MNIRLKYILLSSLFVLSTIACTNNLIISKSDENIYGTQGVPELSLKDEILGRTQNTIEIRKADYETAVYAQISKPAMKGVDLIVSYDKDYLTTYNEEHGTKFRLLPEELYIIQHDGKIVMAPDQTRSYTLNLTIKASETLEEGETYLLPLKVSSSTEGIYASGSNSHCIYLVKSYRNEALCDKGKDAVKNILFLEVNRDNPLNILEIFREDGKLFFDALVLFSANINYDAGTGRVYLYNNENVQFLLDNYATYLRPLQNRGIKVYLCIMGNHDAAGVCQLSETGAKDFARELAITCRRYGLDGAAFDDEWSDTPDGSNPLLTTPSEVAGSRLLYESKSAMPDKDIVIYTARNGKLSFFMPECEGVQCPDFIDIAVPDYNSDPSYIGNFSYSQIAGWSIDMGNPLGVSEEKGESVRKKGYGWFMWYALNPQSYFSNQETDDGKPVTIAQYPLMNTISKGLYEQGIQEPTHLYRKNDVTRYPIERK